MNLDYLVPFKKFCNIEKLLKIKKERMESCDRNTAKNFYHVIDKLPDISTELFNAKGSEVIIGQQSELTQEQRTIIESACREMIPWRKGPFKLFDMELDAEWRSDQKWDRIIDKVDNLEGKKVLDIGCNNGYFMFKMAQQNPKLALGIDPLPNLLAQFNLMQKYAKQPNLHFELFGVEHLSNFKEMFDVIFHMGIIYHHRHPIQQLLDIKEALAPSGQVILETIGIPGDETHALFPEKRYAKMRNVWFVPTLSCFLNWAKRANFIDVEVISATPLTNEEQRLTEWCPPPYQSLDDFLDPNDATKTVEGYPAPMRFCISARKAKL